MDTIRRIQVIRLSLRYEREAEKHPFQRDAAIPRPRLPAQADGEHQSLPQRRPPGGVPRMARPPSVLEGRLHAHHQSHEPPDASAARNIHL